MNLGKSHSFESTMVVCHKDESVLGNVLWPIKICSFGHRILFRNRFLTSSGHPFGLTRWAPVTVTSLNRITRATNYGYPFVSEGEHYQTAQNPQSCFNAIFQAPGFACWYRY